MRYYAALIPQLAQPFNFLPWKFRGFSKQMRELMAEADEDDSGGVSFKFIPDAYYLHLESRTVFLLEIVQTHDISDRKAAHISDAFWALDAAEWRLVVVLLYPKYARTLVAEDLWLLDAYADQFEKRPQPYRDAFTSLRQNCAALDLTFLASTEDAQRLVRP